MPGPDKLLLQLPGLPHAALGGQAVFDSARALPAAEPQRQGGPDAGGAGRPGGGGAANPAGRRQGPGSGSGVQPPRGTSGDVIPAGGSQSAQAQALRMVAAQRISIAFLDTHLKDDAAARAWLNAEAEGWLGAAGMLRRK